MEIHLSLLIGLLYGASFYLLLRRSLVKVILGLALLTHAGNLFVVTAGGISRGRAPIIESGKTALSAPFADPLPQALVLTAIVIGFGLQAFSIVLLRRMFEVMESDDQDKMKQSDITR